MTPETEAPGLTGAPGTPEIPSAQAAPEMSGAPESAEREEPEAGEGAGPPLTELAGAIGNLASSVERYHDRAEQREGVIDYLRTELDVLRRGERRGLLRPLLSDMCRLRNDLLRQAAGLPADYDAEKAAELLVSYAESIELALEDNGVVTYVPGEGDAFDPRMHRRVKGEETADPALSGRIAGVQREGYLDIEANAPIVPAEVTVFAVRKEAP